jgi:hypothetical protein
MIGKFERFLIPLSVRRIQVNVSRRPVSYIGYLVVYVFGIRVAQLQMTNPWND